MTYGAFLCEEGPGELVSSLGNAIPRGIVKMRHEARKILVRAKTDDLLQLGLNPTQLKFGLDPLRKLGKDGAQEIGSRDSVNTDSASRMAGYFCHGLAS